MMITQPILSIGAVLPAIFAASGQQATDDLTPLAASVDAAAEAAVRDGFVPGGAVALIEGGKVTLMRGYGVANGEDGEKITPETILQIGSISKTFAAWGVMHLVEAGKVDLDTPIGAVVERWSLPASEFDASEVTIRRLLSHTAGLTVHGYAGHGPDVTLPTIEQSLSGVPYSETAVRLATVPGSEWSYSGGGYTLLQLAVEELTGESFEAYLEREILDPMGMSSSRFGSPRDAARFARAHSAYGEVVPSPRFTALAAAGLHTTLEDMTRFAQVSLASEGSRAAQANPLSPETSQLMQTPVPVGEQTYGLGYQCGQVGGHDWVGHGGSNMVWIASMKLVPETGDGYLVLTNSARGGRMIEGVVRVWSEAMGADPDSRNARKPSAAAELAPLVRSEGVLAAKAQYAELREAHRREYYFSMGELVALGLRLARTGEPGKGVEVLRWVVELKPKHSGYPRILGDLCERLGRREEALGAWRAAANLGDQEAASRLAQPSGDAEDVDESDEADQADDAEESDAAPLGDPDGMPADMTQPVQVYLLLGQSNMLGFGKLKGDEGSLEHAVHQKGLYPYLINGEGEWTVRQDVRNVRVMGSGTGGMRRFNNEWMTIGNGKVGPEVGIGHHLGEAIDAPVMILKSCIGNRALGWDLLPPGSEPFEFTDEDGVTWVHPGYKGSPERWKKGTDPVRIDWYAGAQYDGDLARAKQVLAELDTHYPGATQYEIAGFFWWQGDRDSRSAALSSRYEANLVQLIKRLRKDFDAPDAKFVCASLGQTARGAAGSEGEILKAILAVDGGAGNHPEFVGNVASVYTHPLSKGGSSGGHYDGNAETYMNVGEAMGRAMRALIE